MNEAKEDIGKEQRKKRYKNKSAMELTVSGKKWLVLYIFYCLLEAAVKRCAKKTSESCVAERVQTAKAKINKNENGRDRRLPFSTGFDLELSRVNWTYGTRHNTQLNSLIENKENTGNDGDGGRCVKRGKRKYQMEWAWKREEEVVNVSSPTDVTAAAAAATITSRAFM